MPAIYRDPLAKLREWADAVRTSNPDVWNDLEDLAQSFEAVLHRGDSEEVEEVRKYVRCAPWRELTGKGDLPWNEDDTEAVREAFALVEDGANPALVILGCSTLRELLSEDAAAELRKAAIKSRACDALIDELTTRFGLDPVWNAWDVAVRTRTEGDAVAWVRALAASIPRAGDEDVRHAQADGLAKLAAQVEQLEARNRELCVSVAEREADLNAIRKILGAF